MPDYSELLAQIPVGDIATRFGVSETDARAAIESALPTLVGGLKANADDPAGAASLEKALGKHHGTSPTSLADVDEADGDKIVSNIFGTNKQAVEKTVADATPRAAVTQDLIAKVLPIIAPIALSWLASQFLGAGSTSGSSKSGSSSGGIGDLLGGLLGGGSGSKTSNDPLGGIGDLLGGLLGGGKR